MGKKIANKPAPQPMPKPAYQAPYQASPLGYNPLPLLPMASPTQMMAQQNSMLSIYSNMMQSQQSLQLGFSQFLGLSVQLGASLPNFQAMMPQAPGYGAPTGYGAPAPSYGAPAGYGGGGYGGGGYAAPAPAPVFKPAPAPAPAPPAKKGGYA